MANVVYNEYKSNLIQGTAVLPPTTDVNTTYAVILVTSAYSANETDLIGGIVTKEVASGGTYARQFLTSITGPTLVTAAGTTDDYYKIDAADCVFGPSVTITASGAAIVRLTTAGNLGTIGQDTNIHSVVTFVDFGGSKSSDNGDFTIVWNANGVLNYKQGV